MNDPGTRSDRAEEVHPSVERARGAVLQGHTISLGAPSHEKTAKVGARGEPRQTTVTWQSVAEGAVAHPNVDVVFLDFTGNGDRSTELSALAEANSRPFRSSLVEPFDIWRGDWLAIVNRLLAFFEQAELWFPEFDLGKTYVALQKAIVLEACRPPRRPPRSSAELLKRLEHADLATRDGLSSFRGELFDAAIDRMTSAVGVDFGEAETSLDGEWAWEDASVAYVGLRDDEPMFRDTLGPVLLISLAERLEELYRQDRSCVVFLDAPIDDVEAIEMAPLFGAAWAFRAGVVVLPTPTGRLSRFVGTHFPG